MKYAIRVRRLDGMGAPSGGTPTGWTGSGLFQPATYGGPGGIPVTNRNIWNAPQANAAGIGPETDPTGGTPVVMPGYAGQCSVFGYSKDASGNRINLQVAMPGGEQRTFATEADFQAACAGAGATPPPSYASPSYASYQPPAPQNINISVPAASGGADNSYLTALALRSQQQDDLIRQLALQNRRPSGGSTGSTTAPVQPSTYWQYTPASPGGGVDYAPAAVTQPEPIVAGAPDKPATPWWIWAVLGAGAILVLSKKGKT